MMIAGDNFVFVLNPKAASFSIATALAGLGFPLTRSHVYPEQKPEQPIVAAVWRNDEDRLKSAFNAVRRKNEGLSFEEWKSGKGKPFLAFEGADIRKIPQEAWFTHVTYRLRFDKLKEDWRAFLEDARLPIVDLPHMNKGNA